MDNINFGGFPNIIKINKNYKEKLEFKKKENIKVKDTKIILKKLLHYQNMYVTYATIKQILFLIISDI